MQLMRIDDLETTLAHCSVPRQRLVIDGDNGQLRTVNMAWLPPNHEPFEAHAHDDGVEYYIFLAGSGKMFIDRDPAGFSVSAGHFMVIDRGEVHELRNTGTEPLQFITIRVILTECLPASGITAGSSHPLSHGD